MNKQTELILIEKSLNIDLLILVCVATFEHSILQICLEESKRQVVCKYRLCTN